MNKRMRELLAQIEQKTQIAKSYMDGENKDVEKANGVLGEIDNLQKEYDVEEKIYNLTKDANTPTDKEVKTKTEVDVVKQFASDARNGFKVNKSVNEGSNAEGGYVVPEAIETKINEFKQAKDSLLKLVRVTPVKSNKGAKTFKARANQTGFTQVGEGSAIGAKSTPQFSRISYEIKKYAGYFPVTNEVLDDTDANLVETLVTWIGDESRVTANKLIKGVIDAQTAVALDGLDSIKKAFNVTLGSAFKATSSIVTNDDGLNYLDCLKDSTGRYLLSPDPLNPMQSRLAVGASFVPVKCYPNEDLPNGESYALTGDTTVNKAKTYYTRSGSEGAYVYTKVASPASSGLSTYYEHTIKYPFILGDLYEAVEFFDRKQLNIKVSDTAVVGDLNAYEDDLTLYRAIEREDVKIRDAKAVVNGFIAVIE